jgi:hypothetical protein
MERFGTVLFSFKPRLVSVVHKNLMSVQQRWGNFRHGSLNVSLLEVALTRLEAGSAEAHSQKKLVCDVGVNDRTVYRHFPDKVSLLARVAEEVGCPGFAV